MDEADGFAGPRTRAPLGAKTTNAKAKGLQTPAGPAIERELDNTLLKQANTKKPKKVTHAETKIAVHGDESPLVERDVEYCPARPKDLPYESDVFPNNCLNYDALKGANLTRGIYDVYLNPVDEDGKTRLDREHEASYAKSVKEADEQVLKMLEEDWTIGDVPETFRHLKKKTAPSNQKLTVLNDTKKPSGVSMRGPATITLRKAVSALSVVARPTAAPQPTPVPALSTTSFLSRLKPAPPALSASAITKSTTRQASATVASRSTLGYTKGRSASSVLHRSDVQQARRGGLQRAASNVSHAPSEVTVTPARYANKEVGGSTANDEWRQRLTFLDAFDVAEDDDIEPGLRGLGLCPESLGIEDEEEFVMPMPT